jgi:hypothetical protein
MEIDDLNGLRKMERGEVAAAGGVCWFAMATCVAKERRGVKVCYLRGGGRERSRTLLLPPLSSKVNKQSLNPLVSTSHGLDFPASWFPNGNRNIREISQDDLILGY